MLEERPQVEQELAERLAAGWFAMTGFDFLSIVYMVSAEATKAAIGATGRPMTDDENQAIVESVTDAVNEWMNVQKDFILGFETDQKPPVRLAREAAQRAGIPIEGDDPNTRERDAERSAPHRTSTQESIAKEQSDA